MSVKHQVNQQLADLSQVGNQALHLDDQGICAIEFESGQEGFVYVPPTDNLVVFCLNVTPVTVEDREALFGHLLTMNYLDEETHGAALCLDPTQSYITMRYSLPADHLGQDGVARLLAAMNERATALSESLTEWQRHQAGSGEQRESTGEFLEPPMRPHPDQFV